MNDTSKFNQDVTASESSDETARAPMSERRNNPGNYWPPSIAESPESSGMEKYKAPATSILDVLVGLLCGGVLGIVSSILGIMAFCRLLNLNTRPEYPLLLVEIPIYILIARYMLREKPNGFWKWFGIGLEFSGILTCVAMFALVWVSSYFTDIFG